MDEATTQLKKALRFYKYEVSLLGRAHRDREIEAKAAARAEEGNISAAQEYKNLLTRERQREAARAIKAVNQ